MMTDERDEVNRTTARALDIYMYIHIDIYTDI